MRNWGEAIFIVILSFFLIVWAPVAVADSSQKPLQTAALGQLSSYRPLFHNSWANFYQFNGSLYILGILLLVAIIGSLVFLRTREKF